MRKNWIWLSIMAVVVVGVLLWGGITGTPSATEQRLPNGAVILLRGVSYNTLNRRAFGNLGQRALGTTLPAPLSKRLGIQVLSLTNSSPQLVVWLECRNPGTIVPARGHAVPFMILSDSSGTELECACSQAVQPNTNLLFEAFAWDAVPQASRTLSVRVRPFDYAQGTNYDMTFVVRNPAFVPGTPGPPTAYPVRVEQKGVTFLLHKFTQTRIPGSDLPGSRSYGLPPGASAAQRRQLASAQARRDPEAFMDTAFEIVENGVASHCWHGGVLGVLGDAGGLYTPLMRQGGVGTGRGLIVHRFRAGLSTNQDWKLRFGIEHQPPASNELFTVCSVPIPGRSDGRFEPTNSQIQGVTLTVDGFRGPSTVWARLSPAPEELRVELVRVVDDQGRAVDLTTWGPRPGLADGRQYSFGLSLKSDAKSCDFTFAVRRTWVFEVKARPCFAPSPKGARQGKN